MNDAIENIKEWVGLVENVIYSDTECPSSFETLFCHENELLNVSFSSTEMHVYYMLSDGQQVHDTFALDKLVEWLNT